MTNKVPTPAQPFAIADQIVQPGERVRFEIPTATLYTGAALDMSVEVIHGEQAGPVLLICAAVHGDEVNGVEIVRRLSRRVSPVGLNGTLVLVPVVNLFGFIHQSCYLPDRRDLNRCFPGRAKGSMASQLARTFFTEIVERCTHMIDLHTAAVHRDNLPQVRAALPEPGVEEMAMGFGIPVVVDSGLIDKSLRAEASKCGIPAITYEAGEACRLCERAIETGVRGVLSNMQTLQMVSASRLPTLTSQPYVADSTGWHRASMDDLWRSVAELGAKVKAGDTLGVISSPFGSQEESLVAKIDGVVICYSTLPLVNRGEALFHIASFADDQEVVTAFAQHSAAIASAMS